MIDILIEFYKPEYNVKISDYRKLITNTETYVNFKINVQKESESFESERRYNDFLWLENYLIEKYPTYILPPLPKKHNLTAIERFDGPFIDQRKIALEKYLVRLSCHPIISYDEVFWKFLIESVNKIEESKRRYPIPSKLNFLRNSITNLTTGSKVNSVSNPKKFYSLKNEKIVVNSGEMTSILNRLCRVVERTSEVWSDLSLVYSELVSLDSNWSKLIDSSRLCAGIANELIINIKPWVAESSLYWEQVNKASKRRDNIEEKFVNSSIARSESLDNSTIYHERSSSAEQVNYLHDKLSQVSADLESELDQFSQQRSMETRHWLKSFTQLHIQHYTENCDVWRQVIASFNDTSHAAMFQSTKLDLPQHYVSFEQHKS